MKKYKLNRIVLLFLILFININAQNDTLRILHISDPHVFFNLENAHPIFAELRLRLNGSEDSLRKFLTNISQKIKADVGVITGDLIDYFEASSNNTKKMIGNQIEKFGTMYNSFVFPLYLILGNHDICKYKVNEKDSIKIEIQSYADKARAAWIRNVSCFENGTYYKRVFKVDKTNYHFFFLDNGYQLKGKNRVLDDTQLDWLTEQLEQIENEPVIFFIHRYLPVGDKNNDGIYFRKNKPISWPAENDCSKGLLKILNENNNIKAMFVGHQHRNVWEEIDFPSGNKIYQIETSALFKSTDNWRLLKFTEDTIIISKPGSNENEIKIKIEKEFIPERINGFKVKVSKQGNKYFKTPSKKKNIIPLPEKIYKIVKLLSPEKAEITNWKYNADKDYYSVNVWEGKAVFRFKISSAGQLQKLSFKSYSAYQNIKSNNSIVQGSRQKIAKEFFPLRALNILKKITGGKKQISFYKVNTPYGKKYLAVVEDMVYLFNKNGQLQAADLIENGALNENNSANLHSLKTHEEVLTDCDSLLKNYKERFNFNNAIKKIKSTVNGNSQFRFIVMGDNRSNKKVWSTIIEHIAKIKPKPNFIINSGDLVDHGYAEEYADYFIPPLLKTDIPFFIAIGNHDDGARDSAIEYRYLFGENSLNYYFDLGNYRFIMFDNASRLNTHGEALLWLEKVLSGTPKELSIIVITHQPPATVKKWAWHAWDKKNSKVFVALMIKYKVKQVFLGHIHGYSTEIIGGIPFTVSGGGGAELRGEKFGEEGNMFHYIICDAKPDGTIKQKIIKIIKN